MTSLVQTDPDLEYSCRNLGQWLSTRIPEVFVHAWQHKVLVKLRKKENEMGFLWCQMSYNSRREWRSAQTLMPRFYFKAGTIFTACGPSCTCFHLYWNALHLASKLSNHLMLSKLVSTGDSPGSSARTAGMNIKQDENDSLAANVKWTLLKLQRNSASIFMRWGSRSAWKPAWILMRRIFACCRWNHWSHWFPETNIRLYYVCFIYI